MSATAIAISSAASASAAAASARARKAECMVRLEQYDVKTATVEQARDYASCVYTLHGSGEPLDPASAMLLKICIILVLAGAAVGGYRGWNYDGLIGAFFFTIGAATITAAALFAVGVAALGINFLFS